MRSKQERKGIVAGGNFIIDQIKIVDQHPVQNQLSHILGQYTSTGGSPYNILKNLSLLQAPFKLAGIGVVGNDPNGKLVLDDCIKNDIDKKGIKITDKAITSYTDVITNDLDASRTLLHYKGANALLDIEHFRLDKYRYKIFHLGYLMLLESLDKTNERGRTRGSSLLQQAQEMGFMTSANMIDGKSEEMQKVLFPSLPYLDYLFLDAKELKKLIPQKEDIVESAFELIQKGVKKWVIIANEKVIIAINNQKQVFKKSKVNVPAEIVKGKAGEREAIISGMLWAFHEDLSIEEGLAIGVATAAACLRDASCTKGVLPLKETLAFADKYGYYED